MPAGFSKKMQMPCTLVGEDAIPLLLQRANVLPSTSDSDLHVRISDAVDNNAYARWACKLKNRHPKFDEDIEVSTPVSKYVPKDRFIPDGMSSFTRQVKRVADCLLAWIGIDSILSLIFDLLYRSQMGRRRTSHLQTGAYRSFRSSVQYL